MKFVCEHSDCDVIYNATAFDYGRCPLCNAQRDLRDAESKIETLEDRIGDLETEVSDLREEKQALQLQIAELTRTRVGWTREGF